MSEDPTGSGSANLGGSTAPRATGGASAAAVAGGAGAGPVPNGGASALVRLTRGVLPEHGHETPSTGGVIDYLRTAWGDDHLLPGADAHPEYATDVGLAAVQADLAAVYTKTDADARFQGLAAKGQPDGYAPLSAAGLLPTAHLPPLAINDTFVVASPAAMLALDAQPGDMAVRTDNGRTYVLAADPPTALGNWKEVLAAGQVQSVNGHTGVVSLTAADVGAAAVDHTHPSEESGQWRFQNNPTIADPGSGYLRSNTGALATATVLALSRTTQDGYDIPPPGFGLTAGDTIYLQDRDDSTRWVRYTALEPLARFATYATGAVAVAGSAGSLAHGTVCQVVFHLAGGGGGGGGGGSVAADALWDAKGDLAVGTGADAAARLAVGANGYVLTADSAQATGLAWATRGHDHTAADGSGVLTNEAHDGYSQYANLGSDPATPGTNTIRLYAKDNGSGVATLYYRSESGTVYELPTLTTGGNGSGAPSNAGYVTLAAESKLSAEAVLGTAVIMAGTAAGRPAAATAGRLHWATDTGVLARDTGSAWVEIARAETAVRLAQLADVALGTPTDGYVLTYSTGAGKWQAAAGGGGGGGLPTTGGTMTGPITADGAGVDSGGALAVVGPGATVTDARLYGSGSPALTPADVSLTSGREYGLRFTSAGAQYLVAVRWYRHLTTAPPTSVRLWDTTSTAVAVWSTTALGDWANTTLGWKEQRLPAGTQPLLVAGRQYVLSYTAGATGTMGKGTYTPLPDAGLTAAEHVNVTTGGAYPTSVTSTAYGIDGGFRAGLVAPTPAASGALRLPNDTDGAIKWRNATDGADLSLRMDAADRLALVVGTTALTTSATAGAASALPGAPATYLTIVVNGTSYKLAAWT